MISDQNGISHEEQHVFFHLADFDGNASDAGHPEAIEAARRRARQLLGRSILTSIGLELVAFTVSLRSRRRGARLIQKTSGLGSPSELDSNRATCDSHP
jgi:hypothetical protein